MDKKQLIDFEEWCIDTYKEGKLRSPIHLSRGNEKQLIDIFKFIREDDWVFSNYRSHYHSLLKGVPVQWLKKWILNDKSIHVFNSEHKVLTSAIVGGTLSMALGVALAIKMDKKPNKVWCFLGDMAGRTGGFWEALNYAKNHNLPITYVIEDNKLSTDTKTEEVWNDLNIRYYKELLEQFPDHLAYYSYTRELPHYGCGVFVDFEELKQEGNF